MLRSLFIALSQNKPIRHLAESSAIGRRMSSRFVAGMSIDQALLACEEVNKQGMAVTLDALGESVLDADHAQRSADVYHHMLDQMAERHINGNVSLKLTQMGMDLDPALAERVVNGLIQHAAQQDSFVRIDMEGSPYTEATIAMTERLYHQLDHTGTVLQAYLYRTEADLERLLAQGIRIRLCKGAYKEAASVAFPVKADVDRNYVKLAQRAITSGVFCGIATHDELIVNQLTTFVAQQGIDKSAFEFQMLYGVRRDLQRQLVQQGFGVRIYVPFGPEWYPYFMRRLAERPANVLFIAKNLFKN